MVARTTPVDAHVGRRVRLRRKLLRLSQGQLADALGLTFQQVQKYENGSNRIGASRLYQLSCVLEVPVSFFFDDMPVALGPQRQADDVAPATAACPRHTREAIELVSAYDRIVDAAVRRRLLQLVSELGSGVTATA